MDDYRLLAGLLLVKRKKEELENSGIENPEERLDWWYNNTKGQGFSSNNLKND